MHPCIVPLQNFTAAEAAEEGLLEAVEVAVANSFVAAAAEGP